jgi:hypothetical protein
MKPRFAVVLVLLVIAALAITGYFMGKKDSAPAVPAYPLTPEDVTAPATDLASSTDAIPFPNGAPAADLSAWAQYSNQAKGYSISYPSDLIRAVNADGSISLAFPKNVYFHWPLLDDAQITIAVGPTCPAMATAGLSGGPKPVSFSLNGQTWQRTIGSEVAAGNRYEEIAYDLSQNGICYHVGLLDHGANGSSLYVDDSSLITKYDAAHDADLQTVILILNTMVGTFKASGLKG